MEGKRLCSFLEEELKSIFNGNIKRKYYQKGEQMYMGGKRQSVINYVVENKKSRKRIERMVAKLKLRIIGNCVNKEKSLNIKKREKGKEEGEKRSINKRRKKKIREIVWED